MLQTGQIGYTKIKCNLNHKTVYAFAFLLDCFLDLGFLISIFGCYFGYCSPEHVFLFLISFFGSGVLDFDLWVLFSDIFDWCCFYWVIFLILSFVSPFVDLIVGSFFSNLVLLSYLVFRIVSPGSRALALTLGSCFPDLLCFNF